ncbi:MAG TPA: hypothetical protein VHL80_16295, partial [Polyangia bacterium]|nr:hypothetical protein [Polyangia bacterium]
AGAGAGADAVCFPPAAGVPGQSGLPDWWAGAAPFDDPRWSGSFAFGFPNATLSALVDDTATPAALVLRWHVASDPGSVAPGDAVWVGFHNTTTGTATVLRLTRVAAATTSAGMAGAALSVAAFQRTAAQTAWTSADVPARISADARLDVGCSGSGSSIVCPTWTVRARVPTTAAAGGIDLDQSFLMWSEVDVQNGTDGTRTTDSWPSGAAAVDAAGDPASLPEPQGCAAPVSAAWLAVSTAGTSCAPGIKLQPADISVTNQIGPGGAIIDVSGLNTFHVQPLNETQTALSPMAVQATLRIADWHASIGDSPLWLPIPDATCAAATGSEGGPVAGGARFDLTCTWTPNAVQRCSYRPDLSPAGCTPDTTGPLFAQQAILVELAAAGTPVTFSSGSAATTFSFASH